MNQYFLESILLALLYWPLGMIIVERATLIYIIFGYIRNLSQIGWRQMGIRVRVVRGSHIIHNNMATCLMFIETG